MDQEKLPRENDLGENQTEGDAEVIDIRTGKPLTPDKAPTVWKVRRNDNGVLEGLPPGIEEKDIITFVSPDGTLMAHGGNAEVLEIVRKEREEWKG